MRDIDAGKWVATLLKLNGRQGTFLFGDRIRATPLGSAGGSPLVDGGGQTGQSLVTKGWPLSTDGNLLAGDWLQIGDSGALPPGVFSATTSWLTDLFIISRTATQIAVRFTDACPSVGGTMDWSVGTQFGIKNVNPGAGEVSVSATTNPPTSSGTPRLYRVLNDVDSDSNGDAVIDIWPRLREPPEDGATIYVSNCKGVFRLKDNNMNWNIDVARLYGLEFEAVEAW